VSWEDCEEYVGIDHKCIVSACVRVINVWAVSEQGVFVFILCFYL
jgi:hypothetical protein